MSKPLGTQIPFSIGWKEFTNYWEAIGFYDGMQADGYEVHWKEVE